MNAKTGTILAAVGALAACAAGWMALPALQSAEGAVDRDASVSLERARRLLHQYNANLTYKSMLADWLGAEVAELEPDDLGSEMEDDYQRLHAALWEAYTPSEWSRQGGPPRTAQANYGNVPGQIREGLDGFEDTAARNRQLLAQAESAVDEALSISAGDVSSRSHAEANRLKATILYQTGLARRLEARLYRRESDEHRRALVDLATEAKAAQATAQQAAGSVAEAIGELSADAADLEEDIESDHQALAALDTRIDDLKNRIDAAKSRRRDALNELQALKSEGVDFADPNGADRFRIRLMSFEQAFREAAREVHALEFGDYSQATIDHTGDFLAGDYVEGGSGENLTVEYGLSHYRDERAVLAEAIDGKQRRLADLRADLSRLEGIRDAQAASRSQAEAQLVQHAATAGEVYAELNRVESEASAIEGDALGILDQSARTAEQAARYSERWIRDARDWTQGLSPDAKSRSAFDARLRDGWMGGFMIAEEADARLARAWIYLDRFEAAGRNGELLADVAEVLQLAEADVETERQKRADAHEAGLEEVTAVMESLERAYRGGERHWTISAQAAGATYLLALFGHPDYVADTIEAYRNAVKGRESEEYAETFVSRLSRLEQR